MHSREEDANKRNRRLSVLVSCFVINAFGVNLNLNLIAQNDVVLVEVGMNEMQQEIRESKQPESVNEMRVVGGDGKKKVRDDCG